MNRAEQYTLTGTTAITTIPAGSRRFGDVLRIVATQAGQQLAAGGNLSLRGDWTSAASGDWIELFCDATNWVEVARKIEPALALPVPVVERGAIVPGSSTTSAKVLDFNALIGTSSSVTAAGAMKAAFYLPLSTWALGGKTLKLRLRAAVTTGDTPPGTSLTFRLYQAAHEAATLAALRISNPQASTVIASPAANSVAAGSTDIDPVALALPDGFYCLGVVPGATLAASSDVMAKAHLSRLYV